jgi:hypothetical protein
LIEASISDHTTLRGTPITTVQPLNGELLYIE